MKSKIMAWCSEEITIQRHWLLAMGGLVVCFALLSLVLVKI